MEERLAISDEILKVTELWLIDGRIIGLSDDAIPKCKPDAAGCRVGGPNPILSSVSPSGLDAWVSESFVCVARFHLRLLICVQTATLTRQRSVRKSTP